jgi:hypothetical protein
MPNSHTNEANQNKVFCSGCEGWFHARGFRTHQNSCLRKAQQYQRDKNFEVKLEEQTLQKQAGKHYLYLI